MAKLLGSLAAVASAGGGDDDALDRLREEGARILAARALEAAPGDDGPDAAA